MRLPTGPAIAISGAEPAPRTQDALLVSEAQRGDRSAFGRLHERYAPMVHAVLLARVSVEEAEDLTQESFLQAMRKIRTLEDPGAFGPWLAAIARNLAADHHRRRRERSRPLAADAAEAQDTRPSDSDEAREALRAIGALPEAYRETLLMRLVEGLSGPEIAARTALTAGSVRVNLHRGMALLRSRLAAGPRGKEKAS